MQREIREEHIEGEILAWLNFQGISADKIVSEGFFNSKKGIYQTRKSNFTPRGISDIIGCLPNGRYLAIEVKKPSEMKFFDRSIEELQEDYIQAQRRWVSSATLKRYIHSVEQRAYLDSKVKNGGIAFFASSIEECIEKFKDFWIEFE